MVSIIGVCGRSCSGKSLVSKTLEEKYYNFLHIKSDKFFRTKSPLQYSGYDNWECPESLRLDSLAYCLEELKNGREAYMPSRRFTEIFDVKLIPKDVILVDGFLLYSNNNLLKLFDKKIWIDINDTNILYRRLLEKRK